LFQFFGQVAFQQREHFTEREAERNNFFAFSQKFFLSLPLLNSQRTFNKHTATQFHRKRFLKNLKVFSTLFRAVILSRQSGFKEQGRRQYLKQILAQGIFEEFLRKVIRRFFTLRSQNQQLRIRL
jgi:hypothetical protein